MESMAALAVVGVFWIVIGYCLAFGATQGGWIGWSPDRLLCLKGVAPDDYLPGTHIPIFPVEKILETKPDYLLILPWNFKEEIIKQMAQIGDWGGKFVVPIPQVQVIS